MSEVVSWIENTVREHRAGAAAPDVALERLAAAAAAIRDGTGMIFGLAQPDAGLDRREALYAACCAALAGWLQSGLLDESRRAACRALIERYELDVPGHRRRRRPSEQGLRALRPSPPAVSPAEGRDIGEIVAFDAGACVGRIQMSDGRSLRFGATALPRRVPTVGMWVRVLSDEPHPLGGVKAASLEVQELA